MADESSKAIEIVRTLLILPSSLVDVEEAPPVEFEGTHPRVDKFSSDLEEGNGVARWV